MNLSIKSLRRIVRQTESLKHVALGMVISGAFFMTASGVQAQDVGEQKFTTVCAACHTIGSGRLVGPDLSGVTDRRSEEWLLKFIKSSQTMVKSGDADAAAIFAEFNNIMMPDNNFTDDEIKAVIAYIKSKSGGAATAAAPADAAATEAAATPAREATEEDILLGQQLYDGTKRLENKGVSCISCHNVNTARVIPGGLLAKDLTTAHSRMGGDAGITGILNAPPFPAMTDSYKNNPITPDEAFAIAAFLKSVEDENTAGTVQAAALSPLLTYGGIGLLVWIGLVLFLWNNRKKNTVKLKIYERQIKSI